MSLEIQNSYSNDKQCKGFLITTRSEEAFITDNTGKIYATYYEGKWKINNNNDYITAGRNGDVTPGAGGIKLEHQLLIASQFPKDARWTDEINEKKEIRNYSQVPAELRSTKKIKRLLE